ncbi:fibronectin type III domain-containing protein [Brevundimonas diminuta]|uniref:fibronectin type III domain-containing protein n=1 Tax=Brevundimonas diminuta TaxID=293 RepID=UPI00168BCC4C|nr:fibronectin type III domain-containing protein [Brevundimonas diminuta]MBD3571709.1 fibronectin type III domain-containing protein [Brevundimonas diminuta]
MPQVALAAASFTTTAATTAMAATAAKAAMVATLKSVAISVVKNLAIAAAMSALQPQVGAAGRTFEWTLDPDGPIPFAAGRVGVAGSAVHRKTFGPDLMYYGFVSVISGAGPIDGYETFRGDDEFVTFDAAGRAVTSQWTGEMWMRQTLGAQPDVALPSPSGLKHNATLPMWSGSHRLSGKAAYLMVLGENSKRSAYPTGEPRPLHVVRGLKGWDPRRDSTYPGGLGPCRLHDPSTWLYITNPILWGLKWALGLWESPVGKGAPQVGYQVGGIGAKLSGIDVPAFVAAANVADANGWTVAAYPTTDDDKSQVLDSFLQAGGAIYAQRAGKISCISRAAPRPSLVTITAFDTAGPLEIDTAASRIDRINTIRPKFWSEAHRWQLTAIDDVTAQAYQDEDGGVRPRPLDYHYVPSAKQAAQLAALQIAHTREGIAGVIPLKPHMQRIRPGDAFTITEPGFVLNGLKCLCLNTEYDPATRIVRVSFVSETDGKYAWALGQSPTPPAPPALTPVDPTHVSPPLPGDWTITPRPPALGGGQLPGFDLGGIVSNETATAVIVEYGPTATGPWTQAYQGPPTVTTIPIDGLQPGATYYIAVQYQRNQNYSERYVYGPYTAPLLDPSPTAPTIVSIRNDIEAAFGDIFDVSELLADARTQLDAQGAEIAAARAGEANLSARIAGVNQARIDGDEANALAISGVAARTANTEADIIDLENALANETTARAEAVQQVTARQRAAPNLLPPIRAWPFFGGAWVDDNYPTLGDYTFSTAPGSFRYFDVAIEAGAPFVVSIEGASGNGSRVQVEYHGASGYIADSGIDLRAFTWGQRVEATFAAPVGLGITKARVLLQNFTTASWARAMLQPGSISTSYREDAAVSSLGATVTEQSLAIVDLENQQAIATWRIKSEASGSKPAIIEAVSALGGAYVAFGAEQIYFGGNTVFDDATDTWQTVEGSTVYVRADGAPFGANANLREWWGPVGIALGAMTTANGYSGRMTTAPYNFDNTSGVGFHVKSSHMYISASRTGPGSVGTANVTVEAVGAVGPVDFIVYRMSGDASIEAFPVRSTASTAPYRHILSFDTNLTNQTKRAVFGCSARDAAGNTGNVVIEVEIFYNEE